MASRLLSALSALLVVFATTAQGAPVEGTDFILVDPPQSVDTPGKIEVIEFFWYRCPHCYALEALGEVDRLHGALFNAIHQTGGVRLHGDAFSKWVADWLAKQKVDMAK